MKLLASKSNEKNFFLRSQLCTRAYVRIWTLRPCHHKSLFCLIFDHERSSQTVKTTRVLGCNQRNRKRTGRERGKIAFAFLKNCSRKPWELASQIMDVGTRRGKIGPAKGGSGFRWSPSVTVVPLGPSSLEYSSSTLEPYKTRDSLSV